MADDKHASAIDAIARHLACCSIDDALEDGKWENYPEIGESDWEAVEKRAKAISDRLLPLPDEQIAAYDYLKGLAEQWAKENPGV